MREESKRGSSILSSPLLSRFIPWNMFRRGLKDVFLRNLLESRGIKGRMARSFKRITESISLARSYNRLLVMGSRDYVPDYK